MPKYKVRDLVSILGVGSGVIRTISAGGLGIRYLVEFEEGQKEWYPESQLGLLQRDKDTITKIPKHSAWMGDSELKESILDTWYKLSEETFNQAFEIFEGFGAGMIEWLKETNPGLYDTCYFQGHNLIGVKITYVKDVGKKT